MSTPYATLEQTGNGWRLRFVRAFAHAPVRVWRELGDPDGMRGWFPTRMEGERAAGAHLRFIFDEAPEHDSSGQMIAYEPPHLLEMTWEEDHVRAELRESGDGGCELTFSATFPDLGKAARDAAGWHVCLDTLERNVDGRAAPRSEDEPWQALMQRYSELFPAEASTVGPPDWHPEAQPQS